jgi:two-component system, chemotaxis family, chemotaxis protein CheY
MTKKILVADDDKLILESLAAMLKNAGHAVLQAQDGQQALELALREHPDLVITDVHMPVLDGITMVETLRQDQWGQGVPVIVLSNDEGTDSINQALASGVTVYLSKANLDPELLSEQILVGLGN